MICGVVGLLLGGVIPLISGEMNGILIGLLLGAVSGVFYGALFGFTLWKTRRRSRFRRESGFLLSRLTFLVPICIGLGFVPGGMVGVFEGAEDFHGVHGVWTPLTITLGVLLSVYVAVLWIRMLQRGPA